MTKWYSVHQSNPGGRHMYDPRRGLSVEVYIEADNENHANTILKGLGVYFDGADHGEDCSCWGDRWSRVNDWNEVDADEVPVKDAVLVRDDNDEDSAFTEKWLDDGEYEAFVHPLNGEFYGAYATLKHVKRKITGYGLVISETYVGDITPVGEDGWDETGNYSVPAPGYELDDDDNIVVKREGNLRIQEMDPSWGGQYLRVWSRDKETLEEISAKVADRYTQIDGIVDSIFEDVRNA